MNTIPLTEARNRLPQLVSDVSETMARITITKQGRPRAVLLSADEYEEIIETLEVLSDPKIMASIKQSEKDIKAGRVIPYEEVAKELGLR